MGENIEQITKEAVEQAMAQVQALYAQRGMAEEEADLIWQAMATFCLYQIQEQQGVFYDQVVKVWLQEEDDAN